MTCQPGHFQKILNCTLETLPFPFQRSQRYPLFIPQLQQGKTGWEGALTKLRTNGLVMIWAGG